MFTWRQGAAGVRRLRAAVTLLSVLGLLVPAGARASSGPALSLRVSSTHIRSGQVVAVRGVLSGAPAGTRVDVYQSPYPYRSRGLLAAVTPDAAGDYATTARPDRDTRFLAVAQAGAAPLTAQAQVTVAGRTIVAERALSLGRAMVTILIFRPSDLSGWNGAKAWWRFSTGGQTYHTRTVTERLSRYVTEIRAIITLPAGR